MTTTAKQLISRNIGQSIARHRKASGLTQAELAERLDLSLDAVSRLERGQIGLSVLRLFELAEIFGCESLDLLDEASSRPRDQARQLERLLNRLEGEDRVWLLKMIEDLVEWKLQE